MNYTRYQCPVCSEEMTRDLTTLLEHTDQHIYDVDKRSHPDWVSKDGSCDTCEDDYQQQLAA